MIPGRATLKRFAGQACAASLFVVLPIVLFGMQAVFAPSIASTMANVVLLFALDVFFLPAYVRGHVPKKGTRPSPRVDIDASLRAAVATRAMVFAVGGLGAAFLALVTLVFGSEGVITAAGLGGMAATAITSVATSYAGRVAVLEGSGPVDALRRSHEIARARPLATIGAFSTGLLAYVLAAGGGGITMLALAIAVRWARDVWMTQIVLESRKRAFPAPISRIARFARAAAVVVLFFLPTSDADAQQGLVTPTTTTGTSALITPTPAPVQTSATIQEAANVEALTKGVTKVVEAQGQLDKAQASQLVAEQAYLVEHASTVPDKARQEALLKDAERLKAETATAQGLVTEQQKALDAASQQALATGGKKLVDELNQWRFDEANRRLVRSESELATLQAQWRLNQGTGIPTTKEQASLLQQKSLPLDLALDTTEQIRLARQAELQTAKQRILDQANGGKPYTTSQAVLDAASHPLSFLGGATVGTGKGVIDTAAGIAQLPGATYSLLFEAPKYGPVVSQSEKSLTANQQDLTSSVKAVVDPSAANFDRGQWTGENLIAPAVTWELGSYGLKAASKLVTARAAVAAESSTILPSTSSTVLRESTVVMPGTRVKLPPLDVWDIPSGRTLTNEELLALQGRPLGEGVSSVAYRAGDAVIKVPKYGGTAVIDGTTTQLNYLSSRLGPELVPPVEVIGPGYLRQRLVTGLTYEQLDGPAQRVAESGMQTLVARAKSELAAPGAPQLAVPNRLVYTTVDTNRANFLFDSTGKVTGWFDPVVVTVFDKPSVVSRPAALNLPPSDIWK